MVERFHQTLKKWLTRQPPADTLDQLQAQLDAFRGYYNTVRLHRAVGRRTPAEAYTARPKAIPTGISLIDGHFPVRRDKIDAKGKLTLRHNSRLHHIGLGRRHAGTAVLLLVYDLHVGVITSRGHSYATGSSTPAASTKRRPERERCRGTPVNGVPRHRRSVRGATGYIRTRIDVRRSSDVSSGTHLDVARNRSRTACSSASAVGRLSTTHPPPYPSRPPHA